MPTADELTDETAISKLPALKAKYEEDEAYILEKMRRPNPLLDEDWGKSKMEIIAEAQKAKETEERKQKLLSMLEEYQQESELKNELKRAEDAREKAVLKMLDAGVQ